MQLPNAILTFMDENGDEWLAACVVGTLMRKGSGESRVPDGMMEPLQLKDRAFKLNSISIIER
jgi:hypothetical protein